MEKLKPPIDPLKLSVLELVVAPPRSLANVFLRDNLLLADGKEDPETPPRPPRTTALPGIAQINK